MMSYNYLSEEDGSEPSSSQIDTNILIYSFLPVLQQSFDHNSMLNTQIFRFANVADFWTKNQLRMLAFFCILDMWTVQNLKRLKARENAFASKIARKGIFSF